MDKLNSIVVGIDFSPSSAAALRQAIRIGQWNRSRISAVHIVDSLVFAAIQDSASAFGGDVRLDMVEDARRHWNRFGRDIAGAEAIKLVVEIGSPTSALLHTVRQFEADLLVLGVRGVSDAGVGMLASACVRRSDSPVLLVQEKQTGAFKSVVACVDFSDMSKLALERAIRLAAQDGSQLHVLHIYYGPWERPRYWEQPWNVSEGLKAEYSAKMRKQLDEFCAPYRHELEYLKAELHAVDHAGSHGVAITEFVKHNGIELAVLGTRGKTNIRDMLLGSTAERVVRDCPCSILAIRPLSGREKA